MIVRIADAMGFDVRKLVPFGEECARARTRIWDSRAERNRARPTGMRFGWRRTDWSRR